MIKHNTKTKCKQTSKVLVISLLALFATSYNYSLSEDTSSQVVRSNLMQPKGLMFGGSDSQTATLQRTSTLNPTVYGIGVIDAFTGSSCDGVDIIASNPSITPRLAQIFFSGVDATNPIPIGGTYIYDIIQIFLAQFPSATVTPSSIHSVFLGQDALNVVNANPNIAYCNNHCTNDGTPPDGAFNLIRRSSSSYCIPNISCVGGASPYCTLTGDSTILHY